MDSSKHSSSLNVQLVPRTSQNRITCDSGPLVPWYKNTTSSVKPEVHNISQRRQRRTKPWPQATHTHNHFTALWTLSGTTRVSWHQKVHFAIFWIFWCKMKITQADTPTIWMDCHPIQTNWCPHLCHPTIFTPDALPGTTFLIYPGLGQAPIMLACIPRQHAQKFNEVCCWCGWNFRRSKHNNTLPTAMLFIHKCRNRLQTDRVPNTLHILWHPGKFQPPGNWGTISYLCFFRPLVFMNKIIGDMSYIAIVFVLWRPALSSSLSLASVTALR